MKVIFFQKKRRLAAYLISAFVIGFILINAIGYFLNLKSLSVFAASAEINKFEIRSKLLMEATNEIGVCECEKAAVVWGDGLKQRSAALQYSVMTKTLKDQYAARLDQTFPNWVTGVSSPWVDSFVIVDKVTKPDCSCVVKLRFKTRTSSGPAGDYNASLTIIKEGDFWRITNVQTDPQLKVYTGW